MQRKWAWPCYLENKQRDVVNQHSDCKRCFCVSPLREIYELPLLLMNEIIPNCICCLNLQAYFCLQHIEAETKYSWFHRWPFQTHFLEWNSLKGQINNIPVLVQTMPWSRPGDKPLSEAMMVSLLTHMCATWPLWIQLSMLSSFTFALRYIPVLFFDD